MWNLFAELYHQHAITIYRFHYARTGNVSEAEDLTAETFRAALESFARFRPDQGSVAAWLIGIARHKLADHFRHARQSVPLETIENRPGGSPSPEEAAGQALQMEQISRALHALPTARSEALTLHLIAGLSLAETGDLMGKSAFAVRKLVQRGLAELRTQLTSQEAE